MFMAAAKYRLRFFFDTGAGVCLWPGNDAAREKYDDAIDPRSLPLPEETIEDVERVTAWFDHWMDWANAPAPNPDWDEAENARWEAAARQVLDKLRRQLAPEHEIIDEEFTPREGIKPIEK
jgi:hypothetical protein